MRLDRFLSVARLFKSRSLAAEAISASMVFVDNLRARPAKEIRAGSIVVIDTPRFHKRIEVLSLPHKNVTKRDALSLYRVIEEHTKD